MASVEIYTKMTCPYCVRAVRLLQMKKADYREIAVDRGGLNTPAPITGIEADSRAPYSPGSQWQPMTAASYPSC